MSYTIKPEHIRSGSMLNYKSNEGVLLSVLDWQDIRHCQENNEDFNNQHSPIQLIDMIELFGFEKSKFNKFMFEKNGDYVVFDKINNGYTIFIKKAELKLYNVFVHEFQDLYRILKGEELTVKGPL